MPRTLNRLTVAEVKAAAPGKYADGGGLWLYVRNSGTAQWFFRYTLHGRRREMGLGATHCISLKQAREMAAKSRSLVAEGRDPINLRASEKQRAANNLQSFHDIALDAFESRKADLKGDGKAGRWLSPLQVHLFPKLGRVPVTQLDQISIRDALAPIWHEKPDAARKAINRANLCIKHAAALGLDVDLQATAKAKALLGRQRHTPKRLPAMPWQDVPQFYASLNDGTVTHLALRFLILTGSRSRPVRYLRFDHLHNDTWIIPADLMKGMKGKTTDFKIPLSAEAMRTLEQASRHARNGFFFPNKIEGVISDATMSRMMERRCLVARPHGFRSSLRDWIAEATSTPFEIAETVLGHAVGNSIERAYRRTDFLEQRRELMREWANHVASAFQPIEPSSDR